MLLCELCLLSRPEGQCALGLKPPKAMRCRGFDPSVEGFCADPKDFTGAAQIKEMAVYFGLCGVELKKVITMASREEDWRARPCASLNGAAGEGN